MENRKAGSSERPGGVRFDMTQDDPHFVVRSATLTRRVLCGFRGKKLINAKESMYLQLLSQDREDPGFTTGAPRMSSKFYLVCEGAVGTTLSRFVTGQKLSFADNTFTLPCGHMIYRAGVTDPDSADRVSGAYSYKVQSATWTVVRGPTRERPSFEVTLDVTVANPIETLNLRGRLRGELSTSIVVVNCGERPGYTKRPEHPACAEAAATSKANQ